MTLDSLIAIAGLLIAAYQIMPRARQLELALRFHFLDRFLIIAAVFSIVYLQFYSFFVSLGWSFNLGLGKWNITPERASFVVVLLTTVAIGLRLRFTKLSPPSIYKFRQLCDELLWSRNFPELIALLERNTQRLIKVAEDKFIPSILRRRLVGAHYDWFRMSFNEISEGQKSDPVYLQWRPELIQKVRTELTKFGGRFRRPVASCLPDYSDHSSTAQKLLHDLLTSKEFVASVVNTRPYFGLQFLQLNLHEIQEFLKYYFQAQLANSSSSLYFEIRNNQQVGLDHSYSIPNTNVLLHFLFSDAKVAQRLEVYRHIGETVIAELDRLARTPEHDPNNLIQDKDFDENGRWESPFFAGIFLFDLMVSSALHQGITWHMWLYYFTYFNEGFIRNYAPRDQIVSPVGRERIRYGHFLYQLFSTLVDWIEAIEHIPQDQDNVLLKSVSLSPENDNIPKSSIIALGQCLNHLLTTKKIEQQLKDEVLRMTYRLYFDLRGINKHDYAQVLVLALKAKNSYVTWDEEEYKLQLAKGYESFDKFPHCLHHPEYVEELESELFR